MTLTDIIHLMENVWTNFVITALVIYFAFKYFNEKMFTGVVEKARKINNQLEEKEILKSKEKIKQLKEYVDKTKAEVFSQWIDRILVLQAHNWVMSWADFHFMYYSAILQEHTEQLANITEQHWSLDKIPYYSLIEYEELAKSAKWWRYFTNDLSSLWPTSQAIAKTLWTKSICINAIYDTDWIVVGLLICSSVFNKLEKQPDNERFVNNVRTILV